MNKFQKLAQINKDIEILEANGKFKSASILHDKFIKETQSLEPSRDSGPYKQVFDRYFLSARTNPSQNLINKIKADGFLLKEDQDKLVAYASEMMGNLAPNKATPQTSAVTAPTIAPIAIQKIPPANQQQSTDQTLSDTADLNAVMENLYSAANASEAPEDYFTNSLLRAKRELSLGNLNDAALIRDEVNKSGMDTKQIIAWNQQYNILVQNFSYAKQEAQYNVQQKAEDNIYFAAIQLGAKSKDEVTPQFVKNNEAKIMNTLKQYNMYDNATKQLLRQISLSPFFINKA
jgi:hypothetical protein